MSISNGTHHVVRFSSGEVWYFSYSPNRGILFQQLGKNGLWKRPYELIPNAQEDFSVSIDNQDHLHLICRSNKGELLYLLYNGMNWTRQVLSQYEPARYTIRYPMVIPMDNKIHILFAIGKAFNTGYWSLQHYYWDETSWHSSEITKVTAGYKLSPFYVDLSEKHIHLVYRGLSANSYQIYYCRYHLDHGIWSTPENVTHDSTDCNMPSILIQDNLLHLAWNSLSNNDLIVKYKNRPIRSGGKMDWNTEIQLNSPGSNTTLPRLIWLEGKLWCIWYQNDTLYASNSEDQGQNWSTPAEISDLYIPNFYYIHYSTNHPRDKQIFKLQWLLGNVNDTLSLPLVDQYMDLPKYTPSVPDTGWKWEIDAAESTDNRTDGESSHSSKIPSTSIKSRTVSTTPTVSTVSGTPQSLENILLNEFDKQEEFHYSLISKLDELSKLSSIIIEENRQNKASLEENKEMLQTLKKDMEQVKQGIDQLKSRGLLRRIFNN